MTRYVEAHVRCSEKESKTKMGHRETKARQCPQLRGIYFIEPENEKFRLTMKAARRRLEVPMPAAMLCKILMKGSGETHRSIGKRKTVCACVVDADESTRPRPEGAEHKHHQDHITAKGMKSMNHDVHKFIPMPQATKIPDAKAAVVKEMEKPEKILA